MGYSFPNLVPPPTRVPQWALLDITPENSWNASKSFAIGDIPEIPPGAALSPSGSSISSSLSSPRTSPSSSTITVPTPTPTSSGSKSNAGAIAGGVVGGVATIAIAVLAIFWQRRRRPQPPPSTFTVDSSSVVWSPSSYHQAPSPMREFRPPMSDDGTSVLPSMLGTPPRKINNLNDPTTFPEYQGVPPSSEIHEPYMGNGSGNGSRNFITVNTLVDMPTSRPHGGGGE
ncbi:hypothetical protein B0F90DRAFT_1143480 [Multifurca ochricompacta]|uniref:Uncharacterized protein n=1 Tax=Multifurca ochricompacta TaxID=376703 RepID=A0AAD4LYZ0_9AGAM|nr:hypothetical protein B0F90DRAFT_1143480 [Multifurca ochricompacta]